jgi:hypothetical protein
MFSMAIGHELCEFVSRLAGQLLEDMFLLLMEDKVHPARKNRLGIIALGQARGKIFCVAVAIFGRCRKVVDGSQQSHQLLAE